MFKLGEYDVDEAREIADYLKDAGMKVEIRNCTAGDLEVIHYLEGRMSEIKEKIDEERYKRYEGYLASLKKVLSEGATLENIRERLPLEIDPQISEKRKLFGDIIEGNLSEEEREATGQKFPDLMSDLLNVSRAESFVDSVLERNEIQIGEAVGSRLDDPILRIIRNEDEDEEDDELARTTTIFTVEPLAEVYIDEFSAVFAEEIDEEFEDEYPDEYAQLFFLGKLISDLTEPSPGKIDMQSFRERCEFQMERSGDLLEICASRVSEELARSLEKSGILKKKGDSIKWRR